MIDFLAKHVRVRENALNLAGLRNSKEKLSQQNEKLRLADLVGDLGVVNRNAQNMRLLSLGERIMRRSSSEPDFQGLVVGFADINKLKSINDFGKKDANHAMGDQAILNVAAALMSVFRPWEDSVTRFGGDEFCFLLHMDKDTAKNLLGDEEHPGERIEKLKENVDTGLTELEVMHKANWPHELTEGQRPGTLSVGWGYLSRETFIEKYELYLANSDPKKGDFIGYLVQQADEKMYQQKHSKEEDNL